jgi:pyruvate dehydrogenase E1 component beta subunit
VTTTTAERNLVEAVREALFLEMERDERVIVLGMDVGPLGGVFRATDGLQEKFGHNRVVNMPLAEGAIVGASLGLSVAGLVPVVEIQFLGFFHFAFHQLGPQLGRARFRSRGRFTAPITIRAPFGGGTRMPEFHADAIEGQLANLPGIKIVVPSTPHDAKGLLLSAIRDPDPVVFLEHQRLYRNARADVPTEDYTVPIGKAAIRREGADITLVSWGAGVWLADRAVEELLTNGISATVLDLRTLVPLDVATIVAAVEATGLCVVIQEGPQTSGFAAEVIATVQAETFPALDGPILRVCGHDTPYPPGTLEDFYLPSLERVVGKAKQLL